MELRLVARYLIFVTTGKMQIWFCSYYFKNRKRSDIKVIHRVRPKKGARQCLKSLRDTLRLDKMFL
jgi:hypothetical protein